MEKEEEEEKKHTSTAAEGETNQLLNCFIELSKYRLRLNGSHSSRVAAERNRRSV
jgi:hypothetical protein